MKRRVLFTGLMTGLVAGVASGAAWAQGAGSAPASQQGTADQRRRAGTGGQESTAPIPGGVTNRGTVVKSKSNITNN